MIFDILDQFSTTCARYVGFPLCNLGSGGGDASPPSPPGSIPALRNEIVEAMLKSNLSFTAIGT